MTATAGTSGAIGLARGEMGARIAAHDWRSSPVGPLQDWPPVLRTVVEIMLGSRYAMWMAWGRDLTFFCNDAYLPTLGVKHGWALGASARQVWAEIWDDIGPRIEHVLHTGEATWDEGLSLILERSGFPEETFHTFSYSPLPDGQGGVGGMLCVVTEDTSRMLGERRMAVLRDLAARTVGSRSTAALFAAIGECLGSRTPDLPFTLSYAFDDAGGGTARLVGSSGIPAGHPAAPATVPLSGLPPSDMAAAWRLDEVFAGAGALLVEHLDVDLLPYGPWDIPPMRAVVMPLAQQGQSRPAGAIVAALNPYRPFDDDYRGFLDLFAGQVAAGLADAHAYEAEVRRAEALAELDRAKTAFFSNVSHEFRTPLTLMLSPIEELLGRYGTAIPGDARALLAVAQRNGLRLLRLVNALLDFSRVEAGRAQASFQPVDLAALTADLAGNFRSACERAGLGLTVDCPPLPQLVYVDQDMWEKIVLNLLSNAFKFTLHGSIAVSLHPDGPEAVAMRVRDTGIGIPAEELPLLFERFHRIEGTRGRTMEGSGIGLALVQELVRLHDGRIAVDSTPGCGTTFTVRLRTGSAHLPADRLGAARGLATAVRAEAFVEEALRWLPDPAQGESAGVGASLRELPEPGQPILPEAERPRVLLADDNADMRDYVARLLRHDYRVQAVADGEAALAAALADPPDLVLSDVMMPELDGFALLQRLRAEPRTRDLPVILLSARAGEEARVEGLDSGADDYLAKPFAARELLARVRANLQLARGRRRAAAEIVAWRDRYEAAIRSSGHMLFDWDPRANQAIFGAEVERITGYTAAELSGPAPRWLAIVHPDDVRLAREAAEAVQAGSTAIHLSHRIIRRDGSIADVEIEGRMVRSPGEEAGARMIGFIRDVTELRRAEAHQRMLMDELNHRVKNTLATVQSIAQQSLRGAGSIEDASERFMSRLMSLSHTHTLLTAARWDGAALTDVVLAELAPYRVASGPPRIQIEGPPVQLGPKAVQALGMAFHELATNAAKYGALSVPGGRVLVGWSLSPQAAEPRRLRIEWQERGGPAVVEPVQRGFGSRLVQRGLAHELRGVVELDFAAAGVRCVIDFPLSAADREAA